MEDFNEKLEKEAELLVKSEEEKMKEEKNPKSLGKAVTYLKEQEEREQGFNLDIGWKNVPLNQLPSSIETEEGLLTFYPEGTQFSIRAATVAEIRHFSGIDENDQLSISEILNFMMEKCVRVKIPGTIASWKDIKEIDRFYFLMAIKDYTFLEGENKLFINVNDDEGNPHKIEFTRESLDYFKPSETLINKYDYHNKCFTFTLKDTNETFSIYLPTLGIMNFITNYVKEKYKNNENFNKDFLKYAPFVFKDWRLLNKEKFEKYVSNDYIKWPYKKFAVIDRIIDTLSKGISTKIKYTLPNGEEGSAPIQFPGGIKSLFIISDFSGELL